MSVMSGELEWGKLLTKSSREIEPMRHNVKGLKVDYRPKKRCRSLVKFGFLPNYVGISTLKEQPLLITSKIMLKF